MAQQQLLSPESPPPKPTERRLSCLSLESVSSASSKWSLLEAVAPENQMPVRDGRWTKLLPARSKKTSWTILESDLGDISEAISRTGSRLHDLKHERYWMRKSGTSETSESKEKKQPRSGSGWVTVAEHSRRNLQSFPLQTPVNSCKLSSNTNGSNKDKSLKKQTDGPRALDEQLGSDRTVIAEYDYESGETSPRDVSDQVQISSNDDKEANVVAPRDQRPEQSRHCGGKPTNKKPLLRYVNLPSRFKEAMQKKNAAGGDLEVAASLTPEMDREQQPSCRRPTIPIQQQQPLQAEPPNQAALQQHPLGQNQSIQGQTQACQEQEQQSGPCGSYQPQSESVSG